MGGPQRVNFQKVFLFFAVSLFLVTLVWFLRHLSLSDYLPPPANNLVCSQDSDCVIGIQASLCCSCPQVINKKLLGIEGWEIYEAGKDYSSQQAQSCGGQVACKPCENPGRPTCQKNECKNGL